MPTVTKLARATLLIAAVFSAAQTIKSSNTSNVYYNAKVNAGNKVVNGGPTAVPAGSHTYRKAVTYARLRLRDASSGLPSSYSLPQ